MISYHENGDLLLSPSLRTEEQEIIGLKIAKRKYFRYPEVFLRKFYVETSSSVETFLFKLMLSGIGHCHLLSKCVLTLHRAWRGLTQSRDSVIRYISDQLRSVGLYI